MPSDIDYQLTKQMMLGKAVMDPGLRELAGYIDRTFGVRTINIVHDVFDQGRRPRLNVCFEFESERLLFNEEGGRFNFDKAKQKMIADKFCQAPAGRGYTPEQIWVIYSAFEPVAKIEANERIPEEKVAGLRKALNNEDLWEISRCFSRSTFFVYTDEQVKHYERSDTRKFWADSYFDLLDQYNEFGYFKREDFTIDLDSKENFDKNYAGNWYYYYK